MKAFYATPGTGQLTEPAVIAPVDVVVPSSMLARIATYDSLTAAPRVEDLVATDARAFIESLSTRVYQVSHDAGGEIPYTVIREVVENLIHAAFKEVIVTILDGGRTVRFSDQGPGILDKERAFLPGFSTASDDMKCVIKGVGSGLPVVRECLMFSGGTVSVEDNLGAGTVVTLHMDPRPVVAEERPAPDDVSLPPRLTLRQKQVVSLIMELGSAGPSVVSRELGVGLSTAYRDLEALEEHGVIHPDETGKRMLTPSGVRLLDQLLHG